MIKHSKLLTSGDEIKALALKLTQAEIIAFDTEFIRENTFFPIVEIIQIATDEESWLVDAAQFKAGFRAGPAGGFSAGIQPLLDVLQNKKILKIVHAAQGDQECLYTSFGVVAKSTFDTSVAASLCGYGDSVGLGRLLKATLDLTISKGHARTNWSVRPLPSQLLDYAHADVEHLVGLGRELMKKLDELGRRQWALDLSAKWEDESCFETDVEGLARKLGRGGRLDRRGYAALIELIRWREERVRQLNLPRRWVADDSVLMDIANVRPKDIEHLSSFRGLNKGDLKNSGSAILSALARAAEGEKNTSVPSAERLEAPSPDESQVLELLKCYVGILADRHRIAAKHLITSALLLPLLRRPIETYQDLVTHEVLSEEAARLIGDELISFLHGKRALFVAAGPHGAQMGVSEVSPPKANAKRVSKKPDEEA